jgi:hypothetical protein
MSACKGMKSELVRLPDKVTANALLDALGKTYIIDLNDIQKGNITNIYPLSIS